MYAVIQVRHNSKSNEWFELDDATVTIPHIVIRLNQEAGWTKYRKVWHLED